ncbi:unnamed protein product [Jaminaea pallidilutea]
MLADIAPSKRRRTKKSYAIATLSILAAAAFGTSAPTTVAAAAAAPTTSSSSSFPSIDFDALGSVGVAGSFAGLEIWSSSSSSLNASNTYNPSGSTVVERSPNGTITQLNATGPGGHIETICGRSDAPGTVFVGGNFTTMAGINASNIAAYDPTSKVWDAMAGGLDGTVTSLLCSSDMLIAGGVFMWPRNAVNVTQTRYKGHVAAWNYTSRAWQALDFGGVNGTVKVIEPGLNASSIRLGGNFGTAFGSQGVNGSFSGTLTSPTSLSTKWAPISMAMSLWEGGPASADTNFNMAPQILCPAGADGAGNSYHFADATTGSLRISMYQKVNPRAFRLGNTFVQGRGTQNFSITSLPDNQVLELLYLDPLTKQNVTCTNCAMTNNATIPYQDFIITDNPANGAVNGTKAMSGLIFDAHSWYGASAGLHIFEMLSDGAWARAYNAYNRGSCNSPELGVNSTGSFGRMSGAFASASYATEWGGVRDNVLSLSDTYSNIAQHSAASVSWDIDTAVSGNYSAYLSVPGCQRLGQCDQRTDVIVTMMNNSTNDGTSSRISQNVQTDTEIMFWEGEIQATSENFMPSVVLSIPTDAARPAGANDFTVIADRVRFQLRNSNETYAMDHALGIGLLEYDIRDPPQLTMNVNATDSLPSSTITNFTAFGFTLLKNGIRADKLHMINAIATVQNLTFVGGNFTSDNFTIGVNGTGFRNIVAYNTTANNTAGVDYRRLANGGVNDTVTSLTPMGNFLYLAGTFTGLADNSAEAKYIVRYEPINGTWAALSGGPDGPVSNMAALGSDGLLVSGDFTTMAKGTQQAGGYAIWNTTTNGWVPETELVIGQMSSVSVVNGSAYMVGSISAVSGNAASGVASVRPPSQDGMPPQIEVLNFDFAQRSAAAAASSSLPANASSTTVINGTTTVVPVPTTAVASNTTATGALPGATSATSVVAGGTTAATSAVAAGTAATSAAAATFSSPATSAPTSSLPATSAAAAATFSSPATSAATVATQAVTRRNAPVVVGPQLPSPRSYEPPKKRSFFARFLPSSLARAYTRSRNRRSETSIRQPLVRRADALEPASLSSNGDYEILASAFWQRSDGTYMTILGGNFTTTAGISNLAIYNSTSLLSFPPYPAGRDVNRPTVIRALTTDNNILYVGGDGGLAMFDMAANQWLTSAQSLVANGGTNLTVQSIAHRPGSTTIIVAGIFQQAGMLPCENVCAWDTQAKNWSPLSPGVDGQIVTIDYAGSKASQLIVAGSVKVNNTQTALASWDFDTHTWSSLGSIGTGAGFAPGPATAASVDDLNENAIFVGGRSADGSRAYLAKWDGAKYEKLQTGELTDDTGIAQLTFVPIDKPHPANSILETNRLLVVSGALKMRSYGNVSSAFYDGQSWTPFLIAKSSSGGPGIVRTFTRATEVLRFSNLSHLAVGLVILISIAIGLGVVFLLVLLGLIIALARRKPNRGVDVPISPSDEMLASEKKRPSSLLATLNAATENVMGAGAGAGAGAAGLGAAGAATAATTSSGHDRQQSAPMTADGFTTTEGYTTEDPSSAYHSSGGAGDRSEYFTDSGDHHAGTAAAAGAAGAAGLGGAALAGGAGTASDSHEDEAGVEAHMRFSFEATHPSELAARAGESVTVLDDSDEHWWLARADDGRVGVVPASYVL